MSTQLSKIFTKMYSCKITSTQVKKYSITNPSVEVSLVGAVSFSPLKGCCPELSFD